MIDINSIQPGDTVFLVKEHLNYFSREKHTFTDSDGVEWYRYNLPTKSYEVIERKILGRTDSIVTGEVPEYDRGETILFYKYDNDEDDTISVYDAISYFTTVEEAEAQKKLYEDSIDE